MSRGNLTDNNGTARTITTQPDSIDFDRLGRALTIGYATSPRRRMSSLPTTSAGNENVELTTDSTLSCSPPRG